MPTPSKTLRAGLLCSTALSIFVLSASIDPVAAQSTADQTPGPGVSLSASLAAIEEIIVTARRVEEAANDVPLAITAFSAEDLEAADIRNVDDLALFTPGLSFEKAFGRQLDRPVLRGMSTILSATRVEQNTAFYIDGVFVSGAISSTTLYDLERVEVLKGPQNALFGRSAFAGAVNYVTKKPGSEFAGSVRGTVATHDEIDVAGYVSGPLAGETLSFSLGGNYYAYGGEYRNTVTGERVGGEETTAISGALRLTPTSRFEAIARLAWTEDDDDHHAVRLQDSSYNNCFLDTDDQYYCGKVRVFDDVELNTDSVGGGGLDRRTWRASLTTNLEFDTVTINTITAYNDERLAAGLDTDYTGREPIEFFPFCPGFDCLKGSFQTQDVTNFEDFSQEVRIVSARENAFRWQAGVYYFWRQRDGENLLPNAGLKSVGETENLAAYAQVEYDLSPDLTLSGEMRVAGEDIKLTLADGREFKADFSTFNPKFIVEWRPDGDRMVYASVARGSKPGGFNDRAGLPDDLRFFEEENTWNYEAGYKATFANGRGSLNLAAYYVDWSEQQLSSIYEPPVGRPIVYIRNAGKTRVLGLEIATQYELTDNLEAGFTYALADAEFRRFEIEEQEALTGDPSVRGKKTPLAPRHMATVYTEGRWPINGDLEGFFRVDGLYEAKRYAQAHNLAHTGDKFILNLRLGVEIEKVRLTAWAKNLLDDDTAVSIVRYRDFAGFDSYSAPRAFGVTLPRGRQFGVSASYSF